MLDRWSFGGRIWRNSPAVNMSCIEAGEEVVTGNDGHFSSGFSGEWVFRPLKISTCDLLSGFCSSIFA